jgi:hypothetical protein
MRFTNQRTQESVSINTTHLVDGLRKATCCISWLYKFCEQIPQTEVDSEESECLAQPLS